MKKLILCSAISILALSSCDKQNGAINNTTNTNNQNDKAVLKTVSRTVGNITFNGSPYWFEFGNRQLVNGQWTCSDVAGVCKYKAITGPEMLPDGDHTATGEMVRTDNQFLIAIDKASLLDTPGTKDIFVTNSSFNVSASTYMKNLSDANQNTTGDILIPRGNYQVVEDANTILIVFWNR